MAFLNIVSLPKKIDEIRYSMSNKHIDLIGFSETRLDSNISDNVIDLDGYDIVRKDRSRNGGGVCIYLRSSINYKIRNDLIPYKLEAVCVEISKPHSRPFLVEDLLNQHWEYVYFFADNPNTMWEIWKKLFVEVLNKHAPIQQKKIR